jgi:hypothetical protein
MHKLMNKLKHPAFLGIALLHIVGLSACSDLLLVRVQETVPQDIVTTSQVLKKDSSSTTSSQIGPYSQSKTKSGFQFQIADAQSNWDVRCETRADGNVLKVFGLDTVSKKSKLQCELHGSQGNASIELQEEMDSPVGQVLINQSPYAVRAYSYGNYHPDRMRIPEIYGFRIDEQGRNVAAIELANTPGRAWLNAALPTNQKAAMVGILAALLIQHGS